MACAAAGVCRYSEHTTLPISAQCATTAGEAPTSARRLMLASLLTLVSQSALLASAACVRIRFLSEDVYLNLMPRV